MRSIANVKLDPNTHKIPEIGGFPIKRALGAVNMNPNEPDPMENAWSSGGIHPREGGVS